MASAPPDHYGILGLKHGATPEEIKKAYKKMALKHHPDHNPNDVDGAAKRFIVIQESYAVLTDEKAKAAFDAVLEAKKQQQVKVEEMDKKRKAGVDALHAREEAAAKRKKAATQGDGDYTSCMSRYQAEMARMREQNAAILKQAEDRRKAENERQVNVLLGKVEEKQKAQEAALELARTLKVKWAKKHAVDTTMLNLLFKPFGAIDKAVALKKSGLLVFKENVAAANAMQAVREDQAEGESAVLHHRDYESLTMMRMRQLLLTEAAEGGEQAERQRLAAEMDKEEEDAAQSK